MPGLPYLAAWWFSSAVPRSSIPLGSRSPMASRVWSPRQERPVAPATARGRPPNLLPGTARPECPDRDSNPGPRVTRPRSTVRLLWAYTFATRGPPVLKPSAAKPGGIGRYLIGASGRLRRPVGSVLLPCRMGATTRPPVGRRGLEPRHTRCLIGGALCRSATPIMSRAFYQLNVPARP